MASKVNGPVRVALIGSGGISGAHGLGFLKYSDKIKCVALCDVSADNLKKRSDQLGCFFRLPMARGAAHRTGLALDEGCPELHSLGRDRGFREVEQQLVGTAPLAGLD